MRVFNNDYGKTFIPQSGGTVTVCNYKLGVSSCNPYGLGGSFPYKSLEEMKNSIDNTVWLTDEEKAEIKAEMDRVYPEVLVKSDKKAFKVGYEWNDYQDKYAVMFFNKGGYQISNADFVSKENLQGKLDYLRKAHPHLLIEEIVNDSDSE